MWSSRRLRQPCEAGKNLHIASCPRTEM